MPKGGPINPEQELVLRAAVLWDDGRSRGVALNGGEAQDCGSLVSVNFVLTTNLDRRNWDLLAGVV